MGLIKQYGQRIVAFLLFRLHAKSLKGHGIHSPFVFHLVTEVLQDNKFAKKELEKIEQLRKQLAVDKRRIINHDLGVGEGKPSLRIKDILKKSVSPPKKCVILFQLAHYLQPACIVELGTSLGLSTLTFARACPKARIITVEGSPYLAEIAEENFRKMNIKGIELRTGAFDRVLPEIIAQISSPFLAYIDGNHRYLPTISYFNAFSQLLDSNSCIIIDDIHWSAEMEKAWGEICLHPRSTFCLDFFYFGIIFYKKNTAKSYYAIRY